MSNVIKRFFMAMVTGAGAWAGTILIAKGLETAKDPVKRATVKRKFKAIKNIIFKKGEES